jgi:uncharacterized protein (DUF169 family)
MESFLCRELRLATPIAVILSDAIPDGARPFAPAKNRHGCSLNALSLAQAGEAIYFSLDSSGCPGMKFGLGFVDEIKTPGAGGFEYFLSCGKGPDFPAGEKIKKTPETAIQFHATLPKKVHRSKYVTVKPLAESDLPIAALVVLLANPDQLAALIHLYSYESGAYDEVFAAMCSGCASVLRIPLAEVAKEAPRGVIGLVDIFARPNFEPELFGFTVSAKKFVEIEENSKNCFLQAFAWDGVKKRLNPSY